MHHVVASRAQVPEPRGLGHGVRPLPRDGIGLDVPLDLLEREGTGRGAVQLDGFDPGRDGGGCRVGREGQRVDMREVEEVIRVEEEEELSVDVVRVVEDECVGSREGPARTLQAEAPRGHFAGFLGPYRPNLDRPRLECGLETEAALRDPAAQIARWGQVEADVADLQALEDLAGQPLVADVDPVGALEFAGLRVVDIHDDPVRDGAVGHGGKVDIGCDAGDARDLAGLLHGLVTGPEPRPVRAEVARPGQFEPQVGEFVAEPHRRTREAAGRTPVTRRRKPAVVDGPPKGAKAMGRIEAPIRCGRGDARAVFHPTRPQEGQSQACDGDEGPPEPQDRNGAWERGQQGRQRLPELWKGPEDGIGRRSGALLRGGGPASARQEEDRGRGEQPSNRHRASLLQTTACRSRKTCLERLHFTMTILTRYLLRSHVGPFLFTFSLLTGLMFVNAIAQRLDDLAGKGLPRDVILESLLLALPHTIALTLPMAVLPAVLYTFSELAANSEIIAMSGGGVRPRRLFLPAMLLGVMLSAITFFFNDRVLPEANHRLKNLQVSIHRKSPTFQLRERVVNVIEGENGLGPYYLRAESIDPVSSELTEVRIYDMSRQGVRRTTYATRGEMQLNATYTDLQLRLYDGEAYEVRSTDQRTFQRTAFEEQLYVLRGVGDIFEDTQADYRGDREMSVIQLRDSANAKLTQLDSLRAESRVAAIQAVERALGRGGDDAGGPLPFSKAPPVFDDAQLPQDDMIRMVSIDAKTQGTRFRSLSKRASQYWVEIHKKLVIASACMIFVLIGMPVGVRFSRGGISMVIVVSAVVIGVYQYGMSTGEDWADRDLATPFWSMWAASLSFLAIGILLASRLARWTASSRESGWQELWLEARAAVRRVVPWRRRAPGGVSR